MGAARRVVRIKLLIIMVLVFLAGQAYASILEIPAWLALPLSIAFALEAGFYVGSVWEVSRQLVEHRARGPVLAGIMVASALLPYLAYAPATGVFDLAKFALLAALAVLVSFWYVFLHRSPLANAAFVAVVAAALLSGVFQLIYGQPAPRLKLGILGHMMWIRLAVVSTLSLARMEVRGLGFMPLPRDWRAGAANFLLFLPCGVLLGWGLGFAQFSMKPLPWWQTAGIALARFFGILWVVALSEEFLCRGLIQEWIKRITHSGAAAVVVAAVLFGSVHLPFRGFPNWKMALLATVAGLFYGRAYLQARSVRAAMVAHALVVTTWMTCFR